MRQREAHPFLLRAIGMIGRPVEWTRTNVPTWDGHAWHFARIAGNFEAFHEIAHFIVAPEEARRLPNYGLGTDPDDGPETAPDVMCYVDDGGDPNGAARVLIELYERDPDAFVEIVEAKLHREESLASVVTFALLRMAGLPWADRMRKVMAPAVKRPEIFWGYLDELSRRGVDAQDPLRAFEPAKPEAPPPSTPLEVDWRRRSSVYLGPAVGRRPVCPKTGKVMHPDRAACEAQVKFLSEGDVRRRSGQTKTRRHASAYSCDACGGWHVGTRGGFR